MAGLLKGGFQCGGFPGDGGEPLLAALFGGLLSLEFLGEACGLAGVVLGGLACDVRGHLFGTQLVLRDLVAAVVVDGHHRCGEQGIGKDSGFK